MAFGLISMINLIVVLNMCRKILEKKAKDNKEKFKIESTN